MDSVTSTQDAAREQLAEVPVVVIAPEQTAGRGRTGSEWWNAPRALAVSVAFRSHRGDRRPYSLMAGVAAARAVAGLRLKWPNDLLCDDRKCGGILVEVSDDVVVSGMGVNLWWTDPPEGTGAVFSEDPGPDRHVEVGSLWAAEFMRLVDSEGWPLEEYRRHCSTLGWSITWEPDGAGRAVDIAPDGGLVVETPDGVETIRAGTVRHVR